MAFALESTVRLLGEHPIPLLGLGVYRNYDARASVLQALEAGYRHIDSAQSYRNEEAVGQGIAQSGIKREDIFVSKEYSIRCHPPKLGMKLIATLCPSTLLFFASDQGHGEKPRISIDIEIC